MVKLEISGCRGCFGCFGSFIDICRSDLIICILSMNCCIISWLHYASQVGYRRPLAYDLEPSTNINTVPTPLPLDIILGPQTLSLVFPSTPTSSSTSETRWVRLYISPLHSSLRRTGLTPEWSNWIVALRTCIGFLDPSIVAEQSLMPAEVRTRWMIGGTIRPKPED